MGDSLRLTGLQNSNSETFHWQLPGSNIDSSFLANPSPVYYTNGQYPITQTVSFAGCPYSFTDTVVVSGITRDFLRDTTLCRSAPVTFTMPAGYTYVWDNNTTNPVRTVSAAQIYTIKVSDGLCERRDTAEVRFVDALLPPIFARHDTVFCKGLPLTLTAANPLFSTYLWSNNATTPTTNIAQSGTYSVTVAFKNCPFSDSIRVGEIVAPNPILPYRDSSICNNTITISAQNPVFQSYEWSNGSHSPSISINQTGEYTVTASIGNCVFTDKVKIGENTSCRANIYIPNVFTPNGDGNNEEWEIATKNIRVTRLQIFDRRGELVYESNAENPKWNGYFKEKPMNSQVFVYQIWFTNTLTNEASYQMGDVSLIR